MKLKINLLILVAVLLGVFSVSGQNAEQVPVITVTGTAEVQVAPDEAVFSLVVEKVNKELAAAKKANDESVARILEVTRRFGIDEKNVKTDYIKVSMQYESIGIGESRRSVFEGYEVSKTVIVRLTDLTKFDEFFSEVLKTGVSEVLSVQFETSELRRHKDEARVQAVRAAREKALAMAGELGQQIGRAIRIRERNVDGGYAPNFASNVAVFGGGGDGGSSETFAAGTITVKAQVEIDFLLN